MLSLQPPQAGSCKAPADDGGRLSAAQGAGGCPGCRADRLTVSGHEGHPLKRQVEAWVAQFEPPATQPGSESVRQYPLDGAPHPTTIVEISGRYRGRPMMRSAPATPKDNYQMIVADIETADGPCSSSSWARGHRQAARG